jgi:hypothetical protein
MLCRVPLGLAPGKGSNLKAQMVGPALLSQSLSLPLTHPHAAARPPAPAPLPYWLTPSAGPWPSIRRHSTQAPHPGPDAGDLRTASPPLVVPR